MSLKQEIADQALRSAPPVSITAIAIVEGMTLNQWVALATLLYIVLQAVVLVRKEIRQTRDSKRFNQRVLDEPSGD